MKDLEIQSVEKVINEIRQGTLLNFPEPGKEYTLFTDASNYAIGSVLLQDKKTIGFYSSRLKKPEENYTVPERETLAILKAVSYFKNIILRKYNSVHGQPESFSTDRY